MSSPRNRRCRAGPARLGALLTMLAISATALMPVAASAEAASPAVGDQTIDVSDDPPASPGDTISVDSAAAA